jgi:hypothetical protein
VAAIGTVNGIHSPAISPVKVMPILARDIDQRPSLGARGCAVSHAFMDLSVLTPARVSETASFHDHTIIELDAQRWGAIVVSLG